MPRRRYLDRTGWIVRCDTLEELELEADLGGNRDRSRSELMRRDVPRLRRWQGDSVSP
jgi:hypothetical protein